MCKFIKLAIKVLLISVILSTTVLAYSGEDISTFIEEGFITYEKVLPGVEGKETVTIQVLYPDKDWDEETWLEEDASVIFYGNQYKTDIEGKVSFKLKMETSGLYPVYLSSEKVDAPYLGYIAYANKADYIQAITRLNTETDNIAAILTEEKDNLALHMSIFEQIDIELLAGILKNYIMDTPLDTIDIISASNTIKKCIIIEGINEKLILDIAPYVIDTGIVGTKLESHYKSNKSTEITARINKKTYSSINAYNDALIEAVILNCIQFADGYGETKSAINDYEDIIGIDSSKLSDDVYRSITGNEYSSFIELAAAIKSINSDLGSGGGIGSNKSSKSVGIGSVSISKETINEIDDKDEGNTTDIFYDLNLTPWAKQAVETLYFKGIVSGKSETEFRPLDYITREEFVKLIIEVFDLNNIVAEDVNFTDVEKGSWYYDYISKAKQCKIVKGITESFFGVGNNITRQDIAVIVCNALDISGVDLVNINKEVVFTDEDDISEYAKDSVRRLQMLGVIIGDEKLQFSPTDFASRAEAVKILYMILEYL